MTNKKLALALLVSCVIIPQFSAAQTGSGMDDLTVAAGIETGGNAFDVPAVAPVKAATQEFAGPEPVSYSGTAVTLWHALGTQIADLGWIPGTGAPSFEEISKRVIKASKSSAFPARQAGQPSLFTDPGFVAEFEQVTGARFSSGNYTRFLINGEASFEAKDALIKNAKKSLLISSWAFYDDKTGYEAAQMLIAKHKEGVDVKVIIDDIVSSSHGKKVVKLMTDAGVPVIRHADLDRSGDIWHVKVMIADDKYAIAGGMNFGDVYSHKAGTVLWRDTDVMFSGPAVAEAKRLLGGVWNKQVEAKKLGYKSVDLRGLESADYQGGSSRVAVVLQNPPKSSPILVSIVKAMYGATKRINIENAYFVAIPAVTEAVLDARARGVEVNILTNSADSIDAEGKPIVDAMAKCLIPLQQAGVNIYLKQGTLQTLHSKFMTVDGEFADIGSYNLHPRGERIDTEVNVNVLDRASVYQLDSAFAQDLAAAKKITDPKQLETKPGLVSQIMSNFFYAQLSQSPLKR
ncbi:MAG: phosphatidylserine/phosphatidylglycerophosphate/cardiolipin synthase family protein [Elusimicrobia bacterium]|nr:phosphatidylserine/phosphatidylglycerophosphate/cardiolipin synthase family protein [Elusimicrobiota bacterium]